MAMPVDCRTGVYRTVDGEREEIRVELPDPAQVAIWRTWTPVQRLAAGFACNRLVSNLVRAQIASRHPELDESELRAAVIERIRGRSR